MLAFAAFISLFWSAVAGSGNVALAAARIGRKPTATGQLLGSMGAIMPISIPGGVFGAGHDSGLVLLGVAAAGWCRARLAGLLLAVSRVLHLLFAIVPVHALDPGAWGLTTHRLRRRGHSGPTRARLIRSGAGTGMVPLQEETGSKVSAVRRMCRPAAPAETDPAQRGGAPPATAHVAAGAAG